MQRRSAAWRARGVLGVAALLVAVPAADDPARARPGPGKAGPRAGKVVRVERPRLRRRTELRLCPMPFNEQRTGTCYGGAPQEGDRAALFDFERTYLGQIRVKSVIRSQNGRCPSALAFDFTYEVVARAPDYRDSQAPFAIAVFGMEVDPARASLVTRASKLPEIHAADRGLPWMGVDRDGDGEADMVVTAFECSDVAPPPAPGSRATEAFCLDYWVRDSGTWQRVRRDHLYSCP